MKTIDYSKEGKIARAILYGDLNDIHIFAEDLDNEYIYLEIIEKLLKDTDINIKSIHCIGSKKDVIDIYLEHGDNIKGVDCFYIVDGDFDRIVNRDIMIEDTNFHYLNRYNIESYLIDKNAIIRHIQGKIANTFEYIDKKMDYDSWEEQIEGDFFELFLSFLYVQNENLTIPNSSISHSKNYINHRGYINKKRFFIYLDRIGLDREIWRYKKIDLDKLFLEYYDDSPKIALICGKFILNALNKLFNSKFDSHLNTQELIWDLARNINVEPLLKLKKEIVFVVNRS